MPRHLARHRRIAAALLCLLGVAPAVAAEAAKMQAMDVFDLEYPADPRISPDGDRIVYVRQWADVMSDRRYSNLWMIDVGTGSQRALTSGKFNDGSPRWSPDGMRLAFVSNRGGSAQLHVLWPGQGQPAAITNHVTGPGNPAWSPDGKWLAFTARVPGKAPSVAQLPAPPQGAEWAKPAQMIDRLVYRFNGAGYLPEGFHHVFVVPADGGTARQITSGDFHHGAGSFFASGPVWMPDGKTIVIAANRRDDWDMEPYDTDIWAFSVEDGSARKLVERHGPDSAVSVSPDGRHLAYIGFDDRYQGYQLRRLYVKAVDGGEPELLAPELDRSVAAPAWTPDGDAVLFAYADRGRMKLARAGFDGSVRTLAEDLGSGPLAYAGPGSSFTVAGDGSIALTRTAWDRPGDVAVLRRTSDEPVWLTALNEDLLGQRELATLEEITVASSKDGREIEAWILKPPGFDPSKRYPLILEIHGGPFAAYGPQWGVEKQVWSAFGYVIVYANPRGSTSYGEEFGNLIHHAYPGDDFHDLDSAVSAVVDLGYVDPEQLYVTGGSGGGVLTCWMIGNTDRFRAAATVYPVINWFSWVLTSDIPALGAKYWFPGMPWEETEHYMERSLFSVFENVVTPTLVITGEHDWRTPISESEQYYTALKLKGIDAALVRVPDEPHGIRVRPSHHVSKMLHIVGWFEKYRKKDGENATE